MSQEEDSIKYLYTITDESMVKEIEDATLNYYKELFESTELIKSYLAEIKNLENKISQDDKNQLDAEEFRNQINSINTIVKEAKIKLNDTFWSLQKYSIKNKFFFRYSSFDTYKFYYEVFFKNYKRIIRDADLISFLKYEYEYHHAVEKRGFLMDTDSRTNFVHRTRFNDHFSFLEFYPFLFERNKLKIKSNNEKILSFLEGKINDKGYQCKIVNGNVEVKKTSTVQPVQEENYEDTLTQKDIPEFDNLERFELLKLLKIDDIIHNLDTSQKSKYKVLALIMGSHPDTARKLLTNKYPKLKTKEEISKLVAIANDNVQHFLTNPENKIKIP